MGYAHYFVGIVIAVDYENLKADVMFDELDNVTIYDMPIVQRNAQGTKDFSTPEIGEQFFCILDEDMQEGYILGSLYGSEDLDRASNKENVRYVKFPDGGLIKYDFESHTLEIISQNITIQGSISVDGDINVSGSINAGGSITDAAGNTNHHTH